jgi:hypothetical protein
VRVAWFHPAAADPLWTHALAPDLAPRLDGYTISTFDEARAHDFVWRHVRQPFDLTVFELGTTAGHRFIWPYLFHYPGVLILHARELAAMRSDMLIRVQRQADLRNERGFSTWDLLRAPLHASRVTIVHDEAFARDLRAAHPGVDVRVMPVGVRETEGTEGTGLHGGTGERRRTETNKGLRIAAAGRTRDIAGRAAERAREAGAHVVLVNAADADVIAVLDWPPTGAPPLPALRAMARGVPVIVFETEATAAWPTLDPQTWRPRGFDPDVTPIAVSIDPRDEEHSLMVAMRRLSDDTALRATLGAAARAWVAEYASAGRIAPAWAALLDEAQHLQPAAGPDALPPHLTADGSAAARGILSEFTASVDFL